MDLKELAAFRLVAREGSFRRAAEELYLTQPSVTARIQALEQELKLRLLERTPRGVELTDAGRLFLPYAERALDTVSAGIRAVAEFRSARTGHLRLGATLTVSTYSLPELLKSFRDAHPGVEVSVRTGRSHQVARLVRDGIVQLGVIRLTDPDQQLDSLPLFEEEIVAVSRPDPPLGPDQPAGPGMPRTVRLAELAEMPLIRFDRGRGYWAMVDSAFGEAGKSPTVIMDLDSLEACKAMVAEGLGISLLPRIAVLRELAEGRLVELRIAEQPRIARQIGIVTRKDRPPDGPADSFIRLAARHYRRDPSLLLGEPAAPPDTPDRQPHGF